MIDAQLLPAFVAVAETGSFTQAAARTGLSQSSVSQRVRRLEDSLDKMLFLRDTHRVELTAAGATLLQLYSMLVFRGPGLAREIIAGLPGEASRAGFARLGDAVGSGVKDWVRS